MGAVGSRELRQRCCATGPLRHRSKRGATIPTARAGTTVAGDLRMPNPDVNPAAEPSLRSYRETPVLRAEHQEDSVTRIIEQQTAKVPSNYFLSLALLAMLAAFGFELAGRRRASRFVGMWPAPLRVMGVYNTLVKVLGPR